MSVRSAAPRVALAVVLCSVLPQFLLGLISFGASLFGSGRESLGQAAEGLVGTTLLGVYYTGPVLLAGLLLYLVARWLGVATPLVGAGIGAVLGMLLIYFTSENPGKAILPIVALGAINGFVFVQIAGRSSSRTPC